MRRFRLLLLILCCCALAPAALRAGELEDVIAANLAARGGADKLRALESVRMTGKMVFHGANLEAPMMLIWKAPNKLRMQFTFQGMTGVQAFDGSAGWGVMPFQGKTDPEPTGGDDLRMLEEQADFNGAFLDTEKKGYTLAYLGQEDLEGTPAHKIKVTNKHGEETIVYLDAEHHLEIKTVAKRKIRETEHEIETTLSDYKPVDGMMFAHSYEARPKGAPAGQSLVFEKIELNVDVPDSEFAMPAPAPKPEAAPAPPPPPASAEGR